jgi:3-hydroxyisobutyrate dehydrogenase
LNIVIIGCGEVGYLYASALANLGCSLSLCAPRPSERVIQLVSENQNTTLYKNLGAWLKNAEIVISCTPGVVALDVASEAIAFLKKGAVYADFSTSSPEQKQQAALLAESKEIYFADVVIMGGVNLTGMNTPLLCAGEKTEKIVALMEKLGAPIRVLSAARAGDAASLKLLRTVFTKGLSALAVECIVAARHHGVKDLLYDVLSDID